MEEQDALPSNNFVPCVKWIRRGVAQQNPSKVELNRKELEDFLRATRSNLRVNDDEDSGTEDISNPMAPSIDEELKMETYDDDDDTPGLRLENVIDLEGDVPAEDDVDSDDEDDVIKPTDNLIVVGRVQNTMSILEVYVYNEDEGSMYVHHDILLPSWPLALEWLNYDPEDVNVASNLCAVGNLDPIIQVWDLDLVNCIEPAYSLGRKRSRKRGIEAVGHTDSVLSLSWNTHLPHILASGSVDKCVLLWDLATRSPSIVLNKFKDKIQSIQWHPTDSFTLLTGCSDKKIKEWDCRSLDYKSWKVHGEVERVCWNSLNDTRFLACDNLGYIYHMDVRENSPIWCFKAYDLPITGLHVSPSCPGLVITVAESGLLKVWDTANDEPALIADKAFQVGRIECLDVAPESPFTVAAGGDNRNLVFTVQSLADISAVKNRFESRMFSNPPALEGVLPTAGPSTVQPTPKVREKRPRSADRMLNVKKKSKKLEKKKQ